MICECPATTIATPANHATVTTAATPTIPATAATPPTVAGSVSSVPRVLAAACSAVTTAANALDVIAAEISSGSDDRATAAKLDMATADKI